MGRHGDGWRARVAAAPERGRANKELCSFLADMLDIPRRSVSVVAGHGARVKVVEIDGLDAADIDSRLG